MSDFKPARTRFAPSPTGQTHLGSGRTALYCYLLARQTGGQFILRIEDTDQKRYVPGAEQELMDSLHWLGIEWDEGPDIGGPYGPYIQSRRREIYLQLARQLVEKDKAYYCFCTSERLAKMRAEQQKRGEQPRYDGTCRNLDPGLVEQRLAAGERHVVRFRMPHEGTISVHDELRGDITVENRNIDDFILVKSDGLALYHLAAMADDYLMQITHVIRGSEWLPTFPLHGHIIRAFGWPEPLFLHLSIFLKPSGKGKMSKRESAESRKDGHSIFIKDLKELGYIPEGVINWVSLMGWSYDDHTEFFKLADLIEKFSLAHLNPSPAAINFSKLDHFNGLHIRSLSAADLAGRVKPFFEAAGFTVDDEKLGKIAPIIQQRLVTLDDAVDFAGFFFREDITPPVETLVGKDLTPAQSAVGAQRAYQILAGLPEIDVESAEPPLRSLAEELGMQPGQLFGILRAAITGQTVSPPLFESMTIIGKGKVLERLKDAIARLETLVNPKDFRNL
jgi:glutamyl-tRNA synthetase